MGNFRVNPLNHLFLKEKADEEGKEARYLFVVRVGKQIFYKVIPWSEVFSEDEVGKSFVTIRRVFGNEFLR